MEDTIGPVFIVGTQWNAGFRIYTNDRSSELPTFLYYGFTLGAPQYHFELDGNNSGFSSMQFGIYIGGGIML